MKRKNVEKPNSCLVSRDDLSDISESEDSYESKVSDIERQIKQLDEKIHPGMCSFCLPFVRQSLFTVPAEYLKAKRKIDSWYTDEKQRVQILHEHRLETVYREYSKEYEACDRDCELEKKRIQDYLTSLCEELKRRLEHDKKNIELTPSGDILDFKPAITRKLRRRAGSEAPSAHASNFVYWGDLLLCGSTWPLNAVSCKGTLTSLDATSMTDVKSPAADGTAGSETNTCTAGIDAPDSSRPVSSGGVSELPVTTVSSMTTSTGAAGSGISSNSTAKSNFFGSLGVNLFDGSLLAHLLTSINSTGCGAPDVAGNTSAAALGGAGLTGSAVTAGIANLAGLTGAAALSSYLHGSPASSAVAASLILPPNSGLVASVAAGITGPPLPLPPSTGKKRRQQNAAPTAQLNLLLPENDIYADLTVIRRACAKLSGMSNTNAAGSARKHHATGHSNNSTLSGHNNLHSPSHSMDGSGWTGTGKSQRPDTVPGGGGTTGSAISSPNPAGFGCSSWDHQLTNSGRLQSSGSIAPNASPGNGPCVWIDDGRLYCGQKCYQYGASVILEGRDGANQRCTGTITAIGAQDVAIRRSSDHGICRVTVQQLKQGRYTLWPAKIA
ncbi:hypothetical protein D915_008661 [Fasciola hepatica]|uniref:Sin3 histone deacetylase corepressor complex component SDS3 n=1 Tax=Fasciola hepatica TaxID=6192 RepID=A0A4E0REQ7_FASHE|nr:hypothetical protein D915_008661 [Fasciola hepatica]